ncbi:MAG: porin [Bdellovibrionia bacterium]
MKKSLILASALLCGQAYAGSISFDGRFDYSSKSYNDDANEPSHSTFTAKSMRIDYQGKLNDDVSFRMRARLDQQDAEKNGKDTLSKAVDFAFISHKMSDYLTLHLGKFSSEMGGFEGGTPSTDLYLNSEAYSGKTSTGTSLVSGTTDYLNVSGIKAAFKVGDFTLSGMVTDRNKSGNVDPACTTDCDQIHDTQNTKFLLGLVAKGNHMEGGLKSNISFYQEEKDKDTKRTWTAVGLQGKVSDFVLTADYLMNEYKKAAGTDKVNSIVAHVAYSGIEQWTPALKVFSSQSEIGANKDNGTGISAVLEYKPVSEANFRYHVAYNNHTTKGDSTADKDLTMTEFVAGVRLNADFLK